MGGKGRGGRGAGSWRKEVAGECQGIGRTMLGGCQRSGTEDAGECQGIGRLEELSKEERNNTICILMMGKKRYVCDNILFFLQKLYRHMNIISIRGLL